MNPIISQILSGLGWIIYGSFFEWYFHKLWMHAPRPPKIAFHGHTIVHHGLYKGDESYFVGEDQHPEHILLKPYGLPSLIAVHLPILWAIERFVAHNTFWGGLTATLGYFVVYEYCHWNMHVPRKQYIERFRWFQFLRTHHKLHHKHYQKNFCVLLPLADYCLGTLVTEESLARKKAEREAAIASGQVYQEKKKRAPRRATREANGNTANRARFIRLLRSSNLALEFMRFKTRRGRPGRKSRRAGDVNLRELLPTGKNRREL